MAGKEIRKLNTFHRRCIRDIVGVTIWDQIRTEVVFRRAKEDPIEVQIRRQRLRWLGHVARMPPERPQHQILRSRASDAVAGSISDGQIV